MVNENTQHIRILPNFETFILNGPYALLSQWNDVKFKIFSRVYKISCISIEYTNIFSVFL